MFTLQRLRRRVFFDSLKRFPDEWESARRDEHRRYKRTVESDLPGSFRFGPPFRELAVLAALGGVAAIAGAAIYLAESWALVGWLAWSPVLAWSFWTVAKEATRRYSGRQSKRRAEDQLPESAWLLICSEFGAPETGRAEYNESTAPSDVVMLPSWEQPALPFSEDGRVA